MKDKTTRKDSTTYQRSPLTVSKDGKTFSVCAAKVADLLAFYAQRNIPAWPNGKDHNA